MENSDEIISKKLRIMTIVKKFKEEIPLHSHKTTEKEVKSFQRAIKLHEDLVNDEDKDNIDYLINHIIYLDNLFNDFAIKNNNSDQVLEEQIINNSTFIEIPEWLKGKKLKRSVLNPNNKDNKCFQYPVIPFLYHEQIGRNYCRISNIKPFINNFNWENINFPLQEQDYKTFEMNNK